ncbi:MAG: hypothetical protein K8T91_13720 [Planctomycetes bacterium]|nr:hypothetical protein [Planctomycetota bacterium]
MWCFLVAEPANNASIALFIIVGALIVAGIVTYSAISNKKASGHGRSGIKKTWNHK